LARQGAVEQGGHHTLRTHHALALSLGIGHAKDDGPQAVKFFRQQQRRLTKTVATLVNGSTLLSGGMANKGRHS
jgi:hypothetical protein